MPTPDSNYIASVPLQYYFVNKDTGAPLSAGQVYFYIAGSNTPKFVYQETLVDGAFVYTPLANPMILSSIGTFVDGSGNNVTPFYWPFASAAGSDDTTTEQLYFIEVYDSSMVLQFTLDYWPPNADASGLISEAATLSENVVSNPNFSQVLFTPITADVVNIVASGTIEVGPGWNLVVTGTGTVTLTQTPINADTPSETPYALTITTSSGIDTATLVQTFTSSPRLFTGQYISGSLIAQSVAPVQIIMNFVSSNGTSLPLFSSVTTGSSQWTTLQSSSALLVTANNLDGPTGNTSLQIQLPVQQTLSISSVQLVEVPTATDMPAFIQQTTQQQLNGTFWYWQPKLNYKPINSFLVGWDFPLNPTQLLGSTVAATTVGNGLSRYVWDQTIMFTTTDNIIQYSKSTSDGSFQITNTGASSTSAIIQYLDGKEIFDLFSQRLSIKIAAYCSSSTVPCTVSLYYSSSTIPNINSGNQYSLVSAVSATGVPTVGGGGNYGTWTQIPNVVLNNTPAFTLTTTAQEFDFSGFDGTGISVVSTGYFAIVIGIGPLASTGGTAKRRYASSQ